MAAMDMDAVKRRKVKWGVLQQSWPALAFASAYERLSSILERGQSSSSKATLTTYGTPPNQTTTPADPMYSGGSAETVSSGDDKREHFTELFANEFIAASTTAFRLYAEGTISWLDPIYDFCLSPRLLNNLPSANAQRWNRDEV